ncbi:MAG TPA: class A beta-lactamase [Edaphobacter sp.]
MVTRRSVLVPLLIGPLSPHWLLSEPPQSLTGALQTLETRSRGRLGCAVLDLATGKRGGQRLDERFPMCSTFKFLVAACVLKRIEEKKEQLDRRITYSRADLLSYAPITQQHVADGMTVGQLCEAAMTMSDNTAANLLLATLGGPTGLNAFLRSIGDTTTRLDRIEPSLNEAAAGDPRDTTTPAAMAVNLHRILFGDVLTFSCRAMLTNWMMANKTGDARLRAGLPRNWKSGDKTGSGEHGTTNDIAVLWPPHRAPVLVTAYLTQSTLDSDGRNAILADVGRAIANAFATS